MQELPLDAPTRVIDLLVASGWVQSLAEARRLIRQSAVLLDGVPLTGESAEIDPRDGVRTLQAGKRRFAKIVPASREGA